MAKTTEWSLKSAYPPMLWVDYLPLRKKITAEWLHCAGLTCGEYDLNDIAEKIEAIVLAELRGQAESPWNDVLMHTAKEDD